MATWELLSPRRRPSPELRTRWFSNVTMGAINIAIVRALFPVLGIGVAGVAEAHGFGLLHLVRVPAPLAVAVTILALDAATYLEHLAFHRLAFLWPIHRVHHTDQDFDFTVGFRFHPLEALLSTGWSLLTIVLLGAPTIGVAVWQLAALVNAAFTHANVSIPSELDRVLRSVIVTPDLHRIHHSAAERESGSNLGSLFTWWDRVTGTYLRAPKADGEGMRIGLDDFRARKHLTLPWMLLHPLLPIDRSTGPIST